MAHAKMRRNRDRTGSIEWYTPRWLLSRIADFYGGAYFDPCPASHGVIRENGLLTSWAGQRVYCNPPYGNPVAAWVRKAMTEPAKEVILLVPAYTDTQWFAPLFEHTICFIFGRVRFDGNGKQSDRAPHPSVLVYRGRRHKQFAEAFSDLGPIMRTYQPKRDKQPRLLEVPA